VVDVRGLDRLVGGPGGLVLAHPRLIATHRCSNGWFTLPSMTGIALHFVGGGMVMEIGT
jgi:hypothetical protein